MNVANYAEGLAQDSDGIWAPRAAIANVSYPRQGHEWAFAIEDDSFWFRHRNAIIAEAVKSHLPAGDGPLFDIGGGNGYVAAGLQRAGFETVLVEPGRNGARNARHRGLPNVICATAQEAPFYPGSLPAVGMFDVLEHIKDDEGMLGRILQLLRPGGKLFLTVPALGWLWSHEDVFDGHFRRYSQKSLASLLTRVGFELEYASYFFWFLPAPIFCLRSVPSALALKRSVTAQSTEKDHVVGGGLALRLTERLLAPELAAVRRGRRIPWGSSAIVVARAPRREIALSRRIPA